MIHKKKLFRLEVTEAEEILDISAAVIIDPKYRSGMKLFLPSELPPGSYQLRIGDEVK